MVSGAADVTELTEEDTRALGQGLSQVLSAYRDWNLTSFNFAVIGGGPQADQHGIRSCSRWSAGPIPSPAIVAMPPISSASTERP